MHPNSSESTHRALTLWAGSRPIDATAIGECIAFHESTNTAVDRDDMIDDLLAYAELNDVNLSDVQIARADFLSQVEAGTILNTWR